MVMDSIWHATAQPAPFPALDGDQSTEVLVVGGGIAGVLCAHMLARAGVDHLLIEAGRIGCGTTGGTTGKITAQHGLVGTGLLRRFGPEGGALCLESNLEAVARYRDLCSGMDCDFEVRDAYVYARSDRKAIDRELAALARLGHPMPQAMEIGLPVPIAGAVRFPEQGQFHPLKFLAGISRGLNIREQTRLLELAPGLARTDRGVIRAKQIVIATHFPWLNKHGGYFYKLYQHRTWMLALEGAPPVAGMYLDADPAGLTCRGWDGLVLLGGGSHRTGKPGAGWRTAEQFAARHWPEARIRARWAAQDCMSLDSMPYAGRYSGGTEGLWVMSGFSKWGMTGAMAAAQVVTDGILGRRNPYAAVFSPSRSVLHPGLLKNGLEALVTLVSPTKPRCPHLGCALKWNPAERSWDCPCHGSRFDEEGRLLDGPATGHLKCTPDHR